MFEETLKVSLKEVFHASLELLLTIASDFKNFFNTKLISSSFLLSYEKNSKRKQLGNFVASGGGEEHDQNQ